MKLRYVIILLILTTWAGYKVGYWNYERELKNVIAEQDAAAEAWQREFPGRCNFCRAAAPI
jgi:hypothetical protein